MSCVCATERACSLKRAQWRMTDEATLFLFLISCTCIRAFERDTSLHTIPARRRRGKATHMPVAGLVRHLNSFENLDIIPTHGLLLKFFRK